AEGRAVLLASHDLDFVSAVADRVAVLTHDADGSAALAIGPPVEIWRDAPLLTRAGLPAPEFVEIADALHGAGLLPDAQVRDGASLLEALDRSLDARGARMGSTPVGSGA
ncbi:MAG TPA: hypothetical protein VFT97_01780, partial [Candidatus Eisenbacteria bacterium]|nr:hypothetical protein [Candidatus Eisenbacteria bacterium]